MPKGRYIFCRICNREYFEERVPERWLCSGCEKYIADRYCDDHGLFMVEPIKEENSNEEGNE